MGINVKVYVQPFIHCLYFIYGGKNSANIISWVICTLVCFYTKDFVLSYYACLVHSLSLLFTSIQYPSNQRAIELLAQCKQFLILLLRLRLDLWTGKLPLFRSPWLTAPRTLQMTPFHFKSFSCAYFWKETACLFAAVWFWNFVTTVKCQV